MKTSSLIVVMLITIGLLIGCSTDQADEELTLRSYTDLLNSTIKVDSSQAFSSSYATAREAILNNTEEYRKQWEKLRNVSVPAAVSNAHTDFVNSLKEQYESNLDAGQHTPESLAATLENINEFAHYRADVGYARDDESKAGCQLKSILSQSNLTFNALGVCEAENAPKVPDKAAGTKELPVSEVYILHDAIRGTGGSIIRPNLDGFAINTIYAKANQPLSISFDNPNPIPFVFSFSVYKGSYQRLKSSYFVAGTTPYSGVQEEKLTVTLAEAYTYVDNVHPMPCGVRWSSYPDSIYRLHVLEDTGG